VKRLAALLFFLMSLGLAAANLAGRSWPGSLPGALMFTGVALFTFQFLLLPPLLKYLNSQEQGFWEPFLEWPASLALGGALLGNVLTAPWNASTAALAVWNTFAAVGPSILPIVAALWVWRRRVNRADTAAVRLMCTSPPPTGREAFRPLNPQPVAAEFNGDSRQLILRFSDGRSFNLSDYAIRVTGQSKRQNGSICVELGLPDGYVIIQLDSSVLERMGIPAKPPTGLVSELLDDVPHTLIAKRLKRLANAGLLPTQIDTLLRGNA
jgi:hypothetical protein